MAAVLGILARLPWRQIGIGLAVVALTFLLWKAPWAYSRGVHSRDVEVANLKTNVATLTERAAYFEEQAKGQTAAITQQKADADAKQKQATQELAAANKVIATRAVTIDNLRKMAAQKPLTPCPSVKGLEGVKL